MTPLGVVVHLGGGAAGAGAGAGEDVDAGAGEACELVELLDDWVLDTEGAEVVVGALAAATAAADAGEGFDSSGKLLTRLSRSA